MSLKTMDGNLTGNVKRRPKKKRVVKRSQEKQSETLEAKPKRCPRCWDLLWTSKGFYETRDQDMSFPSINLGKDMIPSPKGVHFLKRNKAFYI
jgi:hypothetical protein